jgi:hypothetical protein
MVNGDSLTELVRDLRKVQVSDASIDIAIHMLKNIGELEPNENLSKSIETWLKEQTHNLGSGSGINFIPSHHKTSCHDLLMVVSAGENNFNFNTMEAIATCINCCRSIKAVIMVTDDWHGKEFSKWYESTFRALHNQFGLALFIFTPLGNRWTVFPIVF